MEFDNRKERKRVEPEITPSISSMNGGSNGSEQPQDINQLQMPKVSIVNELRAKIAQEAFEARKNDIPPKIPSVKEIIDDTQRKRMEHDEKQQQEHKNEMSHKHKI
jgi:hypothetical protein